MMKAVFKAQGLPQVPYKGVRRELWQREPERVFNDLVGLGLPVFVKPANLGSSVGINKATSEDELILALDKAAKYDRRIIVEKSVKAREFEVAVLGNDDPQASVVGEITFTSDFYDYDTKYTDGKASLIIPADISEELADRCRSLAVAAFEAIDGAGLARVDFFYDENTNQLFLK